MSDGTGRATGLSTERLAREADRFGVSDEQVRRDQAISHVPAVVAEEFADEVIFFGGTALSRTHLLHARLSEDIELLATTPRTELADRLTQAISSRLLPTLGRVSWNPGFAPHDDVQPSIPPRELEVLGLIAQGRSDAGISTAMRHTREAHGEHLHWPDCLNWIVRLKMVNEEQPRKTCVPLHAYPFDHANEVVADPAESLIRALVVKYLPKKLPLLSRAPDAHRRSGIP